MTVSRMPSGEIHNNLPYINLIRSQIRETLEEVGDASNLKTTLLWFIESGWKKKESSWPFAALPVLTCQLVGGDVTAAAHLAAAWDFLHLAAHIFDDIADEGFVVGPNGSMPLGEAVNAATTLLFLAQLALDPLQKKGIPLPLVYKLRRSLNQVATQTCVGQHRDLTEMTQSDISLDAYWEIIAAKSGNSFGWACRAGATVAGGSLTQVEMCHVYGYNLGILLQISDDWIDLWSGGGVSDLALGKKTLPVIYALAAAPSKRGELLMALLNEANHCREAEAEARSEIVDLGGLHYMLVEAEIRRKRAEVALLAASDGRTQKHLLTLLNLASPLLGHTHL